jgi:general stress protein 26
VKLPLLLGLLTVATAAVAPAVAEAPAPARPPERAAVLKAARARMAAARYCAFLTLGADGRIQAREVDPFPPEDDLTVWVGTKRATRKVGEAQRDPRVTLYYADPAGQGYVTLQGLAQLLDDPASKARWWKDEWKAFYEGGRDSPDYVLLRVRPLRLEIVSYPDQLVGDPKTWRPVTLDF